VLIRRQQPLKIHFFSSLCVKKQKTTKDNNNNNKQMLGLEYCLMLVCPLSREIQLLVNERSQSGKVQQLPLWVLFEF
jgi:hypothetical protein